LPSLTYCHLFLQDWANHRNECRPIENIPTSLSDPQMTPVGAAASFAALLFPADEERPRLIKVDCLAHTQSTGPCIWTPLAHPHIGGASEPASMVITNGVGGAPLRFPLHLFYRADFMMDGSRTNRAIYRLTGGRSVYEWRGNVLALKFYGSRRQGYSDITLSDLGSLVAHFLTPTTPTSSSTP
jgi:hypothetical protein